MHGRSRQTCYGESTPPAATSDEMPAASTIQGVDMTPKERQKVQQLQRQLVGEVQLADKLYAALVHGGFDHIWWAMQDYAEARGKKGIQPPKMKKAQFKRAANEEKLQDQCDS